MISVDQVATSTHATFKKTVMEVSKYKNQITVFAEIVEMIIKVEKQYIGLLQENQSRLISKNRGYNR